MYNGTNFIKLCDNNTEWAVVHIFILLFLILRTHDFIVTALDLRKKRTSIKNCTVKMFASVVFPIIIGIIVGMVNSRTFPTDNTCNTTQPSTVVLFIITFSITILSIWLDLVYVVSKIQLVHQSLHEN